MDKLEFDNFEVTASDQNDQETVDDAPSSKKQEEAIKFSSSVVVALEQKAKEHNGASHPKVTIVQLKKVYRTGADTSAEEKGLSAMARVNMFLRMKREGKVVYQQSTATNDDVEIKELIFEDEKKIKVNSFVDLTQNLIPIGDDFAQASEDIELYKLNYKFQDVNELYLEEYEKLDIIWG